MLDRMRARLFLFVIALTALGSMTGRAFAHSTTYAVYSKYEATTNGQAVAFVFALDKASVLQLLERDAPHAPNAPNAPNAKVEPAAVADYRAFFSKYLFERFFVSNGGEACSHPAELGRFFWDEATSRVLAVTKYECRAALTELTIRSLVTHDMPTSHELVGDLQ